MLDYYRASKIARMKHEEMVRSLAPVDDYDMRLTQAAGHRQAAWARRLLSSLGKGLASLRDGLKHKLHGALDRSLAG